MVVFTCQHCGSAVNKNKVEKHYSFQCRNFPHVTCVDCLKDFRGDEYIVHTECMTEEQRYSGKDYVAKIPSSVKKRGDWLNSVASSLNTPGLNQAQKHLIKSISQESNVPQKRKKFLNFVKSKLGRQFPDINLVNSVFDILEATHKKNIEKDKSEKENGSSDATDTKNKQDIENEDESKNENLNTPDERTEKNEKFNNDKTENKKKKKNKKNRSESFNEDLENNGNAENSTITDSENVTIEENNCEETIGDCVNGNGGDAERKLSRKEKKEKKKRAKYEAELNEIEKSKKQDDGEAEKNFGNEEITAEKEKKKKKKDKNRNSAENDVDNEVNNICKGKKKKRLNEDEGEEQIDEPSKKKTKTLDSENLIGGGIEANDEAVEKSFNWQETIIKVLESRSDNELSVNRLCKKVINEYQAIHGENHMTYEKLLSKFNKKIHKTPNVKILKDKARLVTL